MHGAAQVNALKCRSKGYGTMNLNRFGGPLMVFFNTIGPVNDNQPLKPGGTRAERKENASRTALQDEVFFSADALDAARAATPRKDAETGLRFDLIERARENIRLGLYKQRDIIDDLAATITQNI